MCEQECKREHIIKTYDLQIYNSQEQITFKQKPLEVFFQIKKKKKKMCHMSV